MSKKLELEVYPIEEADKITGGDAGQKHLRVVYRVVEQGVLSEWRCTVLPTGYASGYESLGHFLRGTRGSWIISNFCIVNLEV